MHGSRRVITFCILTTVLPTILIVLPLYLRNVKYADVLYRLTDSDVIQIHKGQSSIFCEKHSLKMGTTFNAFQMKGRPELSENRKHIRLEKSMTLPDDTLEYWGFYLFKGATVELTACSRYDGSKILVVKGDKILNTCGIIDGDKYKKDPPQVLTQDHVVIKVENPNIDKDLEKTTSATVNKSEDIENEWFEENKNVIIEKWEGSLSKKNASTDKNPSTLERRRRKRDTVGVHLHNPNTVLDAGVNHGGNAINTTETQDASVSSFENSLYECYDGDIILTGTFPYAMQCNSTKYLKTTPTLKVKHDVLNDGYYYYIFYSDNDIIRNDIHVIFDIYKPTFQYVNMSESKICINRTECEFDINFFSDELVIVEAPTTDGLTNYDTDSSILVSVCKPRVSVYIFFPITVLLLILLFAFL